MIPKVTECELQVFRQRATRELNLAPDAGDAEIRKAFLESLGRDDRKPVSLPLHRSLRILGRASESITCQCVVEPFAEDLDKKEGEEVNEFCDSFFRIPPAERKQRWLQMSDSLRETSPYRLRLRQLESGLSVDLRTLMNASFEARKVAEQILVIFCMPLLDRPAYRRQVIEDHAVVLGLLRKGGEELRIRHPDVLNLDIRFAELLGLESSLLNKLKNQARVNRRKLASGKTPYRSGSTDPPSQWWRRLAPWLVCSLFIAALIPMASDWNARRIIRQGMSQQSYSGGVTYLGTQSQSGSSIPPLPNTSGIPVLPSHLQQIQEMNQANRNAMNRHLPNQGFRAPGINTHSVTPRLPNRPSGQSGFGGTAAPRYSAPPSSRPAGGFSPGGNFGGPGR